MKKLTKNAATLVKEAAARINEIDAADAIKLVEDENVQFVDIRDVRERQRSGFVPNSFHAPRGMIEFWVDPDSPYHKDVFAHDKKYVFYCASGWRSALTVATLLDMGFEATHVKGGFVDWEKQNGPIENMEKKST